MAPVASHGESDGDDGSSSHGGSGDPDSYTRGGGFLRRIRRLRRWRRLPAAAQEGRRWALGGGGGWRRCGQRQEAASVAMAAPSPPRQRRVAASAACSGRSGGCSEAPSLRQIRREEGLRSRAALPSSMPPPNAPVTLTPDMPPPAFVVGFMIIHGFLVGVKFMRSKD
uniref:Uncharacterized protein n=1 Tax=Oryza sativa subsp. japonica TaxID=39947 RepID=Q6EN73_ORYSJ|nr:hypothetical protein [Oryza sativa Japonica Group]BAD29662.1 hypothetical protein [Oryza sativa Japonica Group]